MEITESREKNFVNPTNAAQRKKVAQCLFLEKKKNKTDANKLTSLDSDAYAYIFTVETRSSEQLSQPKDLNTVKHVNRSVFSRRNDSFKTYSF